MGARAAVGDVGLADVLRGAAAGTFPDADGGVSVVPPWLPGVEAVVALTGHAWVATTLPLQVLLDAGADGFGAANDPRVLLAMAGARGSVDCLDVLLAGFGTGRTALPERHDLDDHPRVRHARRSRGDVHVHGDERGLVTIGTGVAGLPELSFEVPQSLRGTGRGRSLLAEARGLVPDGEPVLVAVAPGNAASLRAVLAAGFAPIGSVQVVLPRRPRSRSGGLLDALGY